MTSAGASIRALLARKSMAATASQLRAYASGSIATSSARIAAKRSTRSPWWKAGVNQRCSAPSAIAAMP